MLGSSERIWNTFLTQVCGLVELLFHLYVPKSTTALAESGIARLWVCMSCKIQPIFCHCHWSWCGKDIVKLLVSLYDGCLSQGWRWSHLKQVHKSVQVEHADMIALSKCKAKARLADRICWTEGSYIFLCDQYSNFTNTSCRTLRMHKKIFTVVTPGLVYGCSCKAIISMLSAI